MIAAIAGATAIAILNLRDRELADTESGLRSLALVLAEQTDRSFQAVELVQNNLIDRMRLRGIAKGEDFAQQMSDHDTHLVLKGIISGLPHIDAIALISAQGQLINFSRYWPIPDVDVSDRDYFKALKSNANLASFISEPVRNRGTGTWTIYIARRFSAPNGKFLGLVLGAMELRYFEELYKKVSPGPEGNVSLIRRDGVLLARHPHIAASIGKSLASNPLFSSLMSNSNSRAVRMTSAIDGQDRLIAAYTLPNYPIVVAVGTTVSAALANWRIGSLYMTSFAALLAIVVGGITYITARQIAKRLHAKNLQLDSALANMSQGLVMFDAAARLVICNDRYRRMCKLPASFLTPGRLLLDILKCRLVNGTFSGNPEEYARDLIAEISLGNAERREVRTGDGRTLLIVNQPMEGGGWVATHEDITERKQAEALIEESHKNLQLAEAMAQLGHYKFEQGATAVTWSDGLYHIVGKSPDTFTPTFGSVSALVHPDDRQALEQYRRDVLSGLELPPLSVRLMRDDGQITYLENWARPIRGSDGSVTGMFGTLQNVTERKRIEEALALANKELIDKQYAIDQAVIVAITDVSGRITYVNDNFCRISGYARDELLGRNHRMLNSGMHSETFFRDMYRQITNGEIWRGEICNKSKDGSKYWLDSTIVPQLGLDGKPVAYLAIRVDVTDRKRAEDDLHKTQNFLTMVVENVPQPIVVKSVPGKVEETSEYRFTLINRAAEELFEVSRDRMIGKNAYEMYTKDHADFVGSQDIEALRATGPIQVRERTVKKSGGESRIVTARKVAIRDDNGNPEYILSLLEDVTERKRAEEELRRTKIFIDTVIENVPAPIIVRDVTGQGTDARESRFTLFNRAYEELTGESRIQLIGKTAHQIFPKERADFIVQADNKALRSDQVQLTSEHPILTLHNGTRLVTSKKSVIRDENGKAQYLLTILDDVTERRRSEQRIAHMAHHDALTNLPNRAAFNARLSAALDKAAMVRGNFAVMSIDFDRFKEINDMFGHAVGDALLLEIAHRLQAAAGEAFLARLGGDEFSLIVSDGPQPETASALAKRLLAVAADEFEIEGLQLRVGLSIGIAIYPTDGTDAKMLMNNADAALYRVKAEARGSAQFFEPEIGSRQRERLALQNDLRFAVEHGEFSLHYQPQLKVSGSPVGFEALVRWQCPKRGMVPPSTFIPIAEESSLIISMGKWVLREACREAASWPQPLNVAVNVSPIQFHNDDLPDLVHSVLLETGLAPARLELEITEGVFINDFSRAVSILCRLKSLGVQIALDDFGTGYSSLSYLHAFAFDKIKIDRAFIGDLEYNRHSMAIVRAVVSLGRSLNLPVLAEGVETNAQHAFLVQEGCDAVQGYLTGRPLPISAYAELVGRQPTAENNCAIAS